MCRIGWTPFWPPNGEPVANWALVGPCLDPGFPVGNPDTLAHTRVTASPSQNLTKICRERFTNDFGVLSGTGTRPSRARKERTGTVRAWRPPRWSRSHIRRFHLPSWKQPLRKGRDRTHRRGRLCRDGRAKSRRGRAAGIAAAAAEALRLRAARPPWPAASPIVGRRDLPGVPVGVAGTTATAASRDK